jgi:hypothetical protein
LGLHPEPLLFRHKNQTCLKSRFFTGDSLRTPLFAQDVAKAFADAQAKRHDADYDLNKVLSATDARLIRLRVRRAIKSWRDATAKDDKDFKTSLCMLMLLKGQLRKET